MKQVENPRKNANVFSKLLFCWMLPLFRKGFKRDLAAEDLGKPLDTDISQKLGNMLESNWLNELITTKKLDKKPSLLKVLIKTFGPYYIIDGFLVFIQYVGCKTFQPLLLSMLLAKLQDNGVWENQTTAACFAGGLVAISLSNVFLQHHTILHQQQLGMRMRIACCSLLYRKMLRLSSGSLTQVTVGRVVNLMSNDVSRFDSVLKFLHIIWVVPIQMVISFFLFTRNVSAVTFLGILFIMLQTIPIQGYISKLSGNLREMIAKRTDERVKLMDEIIGGIQVIKMYAWEKPFEKAVLLARSNEMKFLKRVSCLRAVNASFLIFTERTSLYITLLCHVLMNYPVDANVVFTLGHYYNLLQTMLAFIYPNAITSSVECMVTIRRIESFLLLDEKESNYLKSHQNQGEKFKKSSQIKKPGNLELVSEGIMNLGFIEEKIPCKITNGSTEKKLHVTFNPSEPLAIEIKDVVASWTNEIDPNKATLKKISTNIELGKLCVVIGTIGAGKSSLLQLILKEIVPSEGTIKINGSIAYAAQEPWLFVATVRNNILFGLPYDHKKYKQVVGICALEKDFKQLPKGDQTLVGERGVSLSGGQKARINLARAVYRRADIYLLDDPLSGLDMPVGNKIFQECITDYLGDTTRIVVTHQLQFLKKADYILMLNNGKIVKKGTYDALVESGEDFSDIINENSAPEKVEDDPFKVTNSIREISRRMSVASTARSEFEDDDAEEQQLAGEEKASGGMRWSVYWKYWKAGKRPWLLFAMVTTLILSHFSASCSDYWVTIWTNQHNQNTTDNVAMETTYLTDVNKQLSIYVIQDDFDNNNLSIIRNNFTYTPSLAKAHSHSLSEYLSNIIGPLTSMQYIYVFTVIIILCVFLSIAGSILFFTACMCSSGGIHNQMFSAILKAPMRFFDINPSGRILNRFSKDLGTIDEMLPKDMLEAVEICMSMLSALLMVTLTNGWLMAPTIILVVVFFAMITVYLRTAQDIKRLEGITRSPVFSHANATLKGIAVIRSTLSQNRLAAEFDSLQDVHTAAWFQFLGGRVTLGFWLDITGILFVACVTFSFIFFNNGVSLSGDIGLAISQSLILTSTLQFGIRQLTEVISHLTSVERVLQYTDIESENDIGTDDDDTPKDWPGGGSIALKHVYLKYSDDDKPVLEDFNIRIKSGWKVGIVGRTGAGKSSLITALFRLAKIQGMITIDGVETSDISLRNLRSKISIIPQEPILFSTTVRRNLDPFEKHDDSTLWNALESVYLKQNIESLDHNVSEGGSNFSLGQRQLICLARAILNNNQILVLDEATANMDPQTDNCIQQIIREKFSQCTVLTIAHRLNTVMDADRVLVIDAGKNVEFNHPYLLLQDPDSRLSGMVKDAGAGMAAALHTLAREKYVKRMQDYVNKKKINRLNGWNDDESISYGSMSDDYES